MSKRKWYTRAIYLGVVLAMTVGLLMVPAVGAVGETEVCGCLETRGDGEAAWSTTPVKTGFGSYSAKVTTPAGEAEPWLHHGVVKVPYGEALSTITNANLTFCYWTAAAYVDVIPFGQLYIDSEGGNVVDKILMSDIAENPVAGASTWKSSGFAAGDSWRVVNYDPATGEMTEITPDTHGTLAEQQAKFLDATLIYAAAGACGYSSSSAVFYIDDICIDGVTHYDLEPCYYLVPGISYDAKGAKQKFEILDACGNPPPDRMICNWDVTPGVGMSSVGLPGSGSEITVEGGGRPGIGGFVSGTNDNFIEISAAKRGDCHIYAYLDYDREACPTSEDEECVYDIKLHSEKKWGELAYTTLDVDPVTSGVQHTEYVTVDPKATATVTENITDMAYATFLEVSGTVPVGHAITHWWLFKDTTVGTTHPEQDFIDKLMDYLAANEGALDADHWAAHGKYDKTDTFLGGKQPFDYINDYAATHAANTTIFTWNAISPDPPGEIAANKYYAWTETEDYLPTEVPGRAQATLAVDQGKLVECVEEKVMIVVLVTYPGGSTAQDDPFNGENIVCLEKGKKTFHKGPLPPPPEQIKAPQVRWAGEKIVLEKEWGVAGNTVVFALQGDSVGSLEAIYTGDIEGSDAETVITTVQSDGVARCILQSQPQGQADVKAALYAGTQAVGDSFPEAMDALDGTVVSGNHDFLVYFLALEDVSVDVGLSDLIAIDAGASANVTVKVKGWFTSASLPGTSRGPVLGDDGITYVRPAGRYVLPDDWAALAGSDLATSNKASRPQYDLMNTPGAGVDGSAELGPYDSDVRTTTPPGEADDPVIGPFNPLQPWSNFDALGNPVNRWIATASVVADSTVTGVLRNTVVPDTTIDWYDCPMPQALVTFDVDDTKVLSVLDKGNVFFSGTGAVKVYTAPFYAVEIPSHWLIPVAGYFWDSWGLTGNIAIDGPYDYWDDLGVTPSATDDDILEVYSDNHGYAGVTIVGTGLADECVTLDVIADFPVMAAKYPAVDTTREVCWGIAVEHLNPDFEVDPREDEAPCTITFYGLKDGTGVPWTTGGVEPYVKAVWDFDDGTPVVEVTGATSELTLVTQYHEYAYAGTYSPSLTVTDSSEPALVHTEKKWGYIVLTGEEPPAEFPLCDIDDSGEVDILDFYEFVKAYGSTPADDNWNPNCDLDASGEVDLVDFLIFAVCYDEHSE